MIFIIIIIKVNLYSLDIEIIIHQNIDNNLLIKFH